MTEAHLLAWIEARVEQLYAEAKLLTDDYWRRWKAEKKKYAPAQQGRIGVRVRRREVTLSFSIE